MPKYKHPEEYILYSNQIIDAGRGKVKYFPRYKFQPELIGYNRIESQRNPYETHLLYQHLPRDVLPKKEIRYDGWQQSRINDDFEYIRQELPFESNIAPEHYFNPSSPIYHQLALSQTRFATDDRFRTYTNPYNRDEKRIVHQFHRGRRCF